VNAEDPVQIPVDAIVSAEAISQGVAALERIHGHHLSDMSPEDQAEARAHWRRQVEETLTAVYVSYAELPPPGSGLAVISFRDSSTGQIDVSATFQPQLQQTGEDEVTGTPAQALAFRTFSAVRNQGNVDVGEEPT
jgi:hypothetical protein